MSWFCFTPECAPDDAKRHCVPECAVDREAAEVRPLMASAKENAVQISEPALRNTWRWSLPAFRGCFLWMRISPAVDELNQKASPAMLDVLNVTQYLGACTQPNPKGQVRYTAGFLVSEPRARRSSAWACWSRLRAPTRWSR